MIAAVSDSEQAADAPRQPSMFARFGRNVAWLASGRGFAAVTSIVYLAVVARALGPDRFGVFSLILAYGSSIAALADFQTGQAVIRFGAMQMAQDRPDRLRQLLGFLATLDWCGAILGALVAIIGVRFAAGPLGWAPHQQQDAMMFAGLLLLSCGSTAAGILRLSNRFDLLTYAEMTGPIIRFVGALAVWITHGGLTAFLLVWALAALGEGAAGWIAVLAYRHVRPVFGYAAARDVIRDNARILGFLAHNSFASSLGLVWQYSGTFAAGATSGAAAAGAFRIASKLAAAIAKPADLITRALFPELARLAASNDRHALAKLTRIVTLIAVGVDLVLIGVVFLAGRPLLSLLYGPRFVFAYPYLLLLTVAAAVDLLGIAFEPVLNAHGHSGAVLNIRIVGAVTQLGALALFVPLHGVEGAGWAAIASTVVMRALMAIVTVRTFRDRPGQTVGDTLGQAAFPPR